MFAFKLTTLAIVATLLTGIEQAIAVGCFSGGQSGDCDRFIGDFCNNNQGDFGAGATRAQCFTDGSNRCDLKAFNNNGVNVRAYDVNDCISALKITNDGCNRHGGIRDGPGGFQYTVDPNAGVC